MKEKIDTSINQLHVIRDEYRDRLIIADSRQALVKIPEKTFQMCVTSPPYWGLRDYNMDGQIGAEETIHEFIKDLVEIFREVRRTLKDDGLLWLNIGDSFTSGGRSWRDKDKKNPARGMSYRAPTPEGLKPKDLIGLPWRLALALQDDGWYLRSDNIWYKPNCQPESVKDRPTRSHEYVFLLSKSEKYYYDHESVKEPTSDGRSMRNRRTVWEVKTKPFKGAHFAVYPPELVEICVKAGSREGDVVLDPFFGSGTTGIVSRELGRSYYGIELNPDYAQIAIERLQGVDPQLEMGI